MGKKIFYNDDARARLLAGAEMLYDAVRVTYGPKGGNVVIGTNYGGPTVTHDGVTVADSIDIADVDDETLGTRQGAELIKQAAQNLNRLAGDGTSTVTILTYQILKEANRLIAAGTNPQELRAGIESARDEVLAKILDLREEIEVDSPRVAQVATISAGDKVIGDLIADVMKDIGKDGVVTVEASQGLELEAEIVKGYTIDRGFVSQYFVTDQARQEAVYGNVKILITDKIISNVIEMLPFLEKFSQSGEKDLVIIAEDLTGEALSTLILNKVKGTFNTVAIKAPGWGDNRAALLQDIAILTGATVVSEAAGHTFENIDLKVLGSAKKVIVGKDETTIIEGNGAQEDVDARIEAIRELTKKGPKSIAEKHEHRASALAGQVAVIKVGGATETEIDEKKFRVDDAVAAVKAALVAGIVPGGGITLVNLSVAIQGTTDGHKLLKTALLQPFLILMENAGGNAQASLARVIKETGMGLDVHNPFDEALLDMKQQGIVDPVEVTRQAIVNAVSIASTAATMGALVVDLPEAK